MAATEIILRVVTPRREVLSTTVEHVVLPALKGEMEVFPNHRPFLTSLRPGRMLTVSGKDETSYYVAGGYAEVLADRVVILADECIPSTDIDLEAAREALEVAQAELDENRLKPVEERQDFQGAVEQARVRVALAEAAGSR